MRLSSGDMKLISRWRTLSHPARVRLFVAGSALAFGLLLVAAVSLRVRESRTELRCVESAGPRILWTYASHVDVPSRLAALETVRAMAPSDCTGFVAASVESETLEILGRGDLAEQVEVHALDQRPWPTRADPGLFLRRLRRLANEGREDEERVLATRAAEELEGPYFIESAVILLVRAGDPDRAIRIFERLHPKAVVHRETLLALASAHRALGDIETAARRVAESAGAPSHPMLVRPRPRVAPSPSAKARLADPLSDHADLVLSHYADLVAPERPTAHWKTLLLANLRMVLAYLWLPLALGLLAWMPASRPPSALRHCVGALTLGAAAAVSGPAGLHSWLLYGLVLPRFWGVSGAIFWSMRLLKLLVILFALTLVERRNLLELGWRRGGVRLRHLLLAILLPLAYLAPIHLARGVAQPRTWRPSLLLGSVLLSLYAASVEETIFRGYLMPALQRLPLAFPIANAIQAALDVAMHLLGRYPEPQHFGAVASWWLTALVYGWSVRRTESLWPAFIAHAVYDFLWLYVVHYHAVEVADRLS